MPVLDYIEIKGKKTAIDDEGYLINFDDWDEAVAAVLARREGLEELPADKLAALRFIREHFKKYNYFPIPNAICKTIHKHKDCIQEDFINALVAWKLAGLPKPEEPIISLLEAGQSPG